MSQIKTVLEHSTVVSKHLFLYENMKKIESTEIRFGIDPKYRTGVLLVFNNEDQDKLVTVTSNNGTELTLAHPAITEIDESNPKQIEFTVNAICLKVRNGILTKKETDFHYTEASRPYSMIPSNKIYIGESTREVYEL